ncbi:unannotated protein [freshwater metagenome]|uniref:Unannotated protein n=1 Tax=freshwater metagenome TaxID=449393 RepID=A0A6J6HR05_9ZZZZ
MNTDFKYIGFFGEYQRRTGFLTYLFLVVFFVISVLEVKLSDYKRITYWVFGIAIAVVGYGLLQHFGMDFIRWNNPYNSVLSTVGNPNFAAAIMAIFSVALFGAALTAELPLFVRVSGIVVSALSLVTIYFSNSLQGFLAAAVGLGVITVVWVSQRNKIIGWALFGLGVIGGLAALAGILRMGPLTFLYKDSVAYRGDYWRAGFEMFKDHPWFGVGLDRYGAYFTEYRDATQVLRRGPRVFSNAAHNVYIQLASTGGIFVLLAYLAVIAFILWRGVVGIRNTSGVKQIVVTTFFAAWLTYVAQSIISIDNIGIAIWGWTLGGIVVAFSIDSSKESDVRIINSGGRQVQVLKQSNSSFLGLVLSLGLIMIAITVSGLFATAEHAQHDVGRYASPTSAGQQTQYAEFVTKPLESKPVEPKFRYLAAITFLKAKMYPQGIEQLEIVIAQDARNTESRNVLADYYEQTGQFEKALPLRIELARLDPFNQVTLLQLGRDLKQTGDLAGARKIAERIGAYAPDSPEYQSAKSEFLA